MVVKSPNPLSSPASFFSWGLTGALTVSLGTYAKQQFLDRYLPGLTPKLHEQKLTETIESSTAGTTSRTQALKDWYFFRYGKPRKDGRIYDLPTITRSVQEAVSHYAKNLPGKEQAGYSRTNIVNYAPSHKSPLAAKDNSRLEIPGRFTRLQQLNPFNKQKNQYENPAFESGRQNRRPFNISSTYPGDVNHEEANLSDSRLPGLNAQGTNMTRVNLSGSYVPGANFTNANVYKMLAKNALLKASRFINTKNITTMALETAHPDLSHVHIGSTDPKNPLAFTLQKLMNKNLSRSVSHNVDYMATNFDGGNLNHAQMAKTEGPVTYQAPFINPDIINADDPTPNRLRKTGGVRLLGTSLQNIPQAIGLNLTGQAMDAVWLWGSQLGGMLANHTDWTGANLSIDKTRESLQLSNIQAGFNRFLRSLAAQVMWAERKKQHKENPIPLLLSPDARLAA